MSFCWWLGVLAFRTRRPLPGRGARHYHRRGAHAPTPVDFHALGRAASARRHDHDVRRRGLRFAPDLADNVARGDTNFCSPFLDEADAYVTRDGLDLPEDPAARDLGPAAHRHVDPCSDLDLAGVAPSSRRPAAPPTTDWLQVDTFDETAAPPPPRRVHGSSIYFLGLPLTLAPRVQLHLGGVTRHQVRRRPHRAQRGYPSPNVD